MTTDDALRRGAATIAQAVNAAIDAGVDRVVLVYAPSPRIAEIHAELAALDAAETANWPPKSKLVNHEGNFAIWERRLELVAELELLEGKVADG